MDKIDYKLLRILDWDCRTPIIHIAKAVRTSKDVAAYRIKRMEQQGIIIRYYPVLDMYKLGYQTSRLYFEMEELSEKEEVEFIRFLDKDLHAGLIFRMDYPYRYGIFLWTSSVHDVLSAVIKVKQKLGKALVRYNYSVISVFRQYPKDYLFNKLHHTENYALEPTAPVVYDTQDFAILQQLAKNARFSTVEIAKATKIPQTTVSHKIRQMEKKGIILGYRAEIDFAKLGFMNYFLEIYLDTNDNLKQIEAWANQHSNVVWLQKIIGMCDIEIEVEVKDRTALEVLLNDLRNRFPNIRKIVFFSQEYKKLTFLP